MSASFSPWYNAFISFICVLPLLCVCVRVHCVEVFNLKTTAQYRINKWFRGVGRKTAGFHKNITHTHQQVHRIDLIMPSILLNSTHITTDKLMPMVEATTKAAAALPKITKTTSTFITVLSAASSNGQNKRTIYIYPTGEFHSPRSKSANLLVISFLAAALLFQLIFRHARPNRCMDFHTQAARVLMKTSK